jgi:hypothetical protein
MKEKMISEIKRQTEEEEREREREREGGKLAVQGKARYNADVDSTEISRREPFKLQAIIKISILRSGSCGLPSPARYYSPDDN